MSFLARALFCLLTTRAQRRELAQRERVLIAFGDYLEKMGMKE